MNEEYVICELLTGESIIVMNSGSKLKVGHRFNFDTSTMNESVLKELLGDTYKSPVPINKYQIPFGAREQIQIRKHKRWRINKKWQKRYGYKTKEVEYVGDANFDENKNELFMFNVKKDGVKFEHNIILNYNQEMECKNGCKKN